jgi:hypothetical protein
VALAALALHAGGVSPGLSGSNAAAEKVTAVDRVLVSTVGPWRGEGLALLEAAP